MLLGEKEAERERERAREKDKDKSGVCWEVWGQGGERKTGRSWRQRG